MHHRNLETSFFDCFYTKSENCEKMLAKVCEPDRINIDDIAEVGNLFEIKCVFNICKQYP